MAVLPGIALSWTAPSLLMGDTFKQLNIKRRLTAVGGAYTRVAVLTSIAVVTWTDYGIASGTAYQYVISTTVLRSGVPIESADSAPVGGVCSFGFQWLHDASDPSRFVEFPSNDRAVPVAQAQSAVYGWARALPTLYVGEAQARRWTITSTPQVSTPPAMALWTAVLDFLSTQASAGSVYAYRNGLTGEFAYVSLSAATPQPGQSGGGQSDALARADKVGYYTISLSLLEISYLPEAA